MLNSSLITEKPTAGAALGRWLGDGGSSKIQIGHSASTTSERMLETHEHLFLAQSEQTHIYQILEGVVGVYNMLTDGRRQIVGFYYPGDLIGLGDALHWPHSAEALCASRVRCISVGTVDTLIRTDADFGRSLLETLATELAETRDQLLSLGRKSALEKLATFLLRISRRIQRESGDDNRVYLPMTRNDIADHLGLTIETVSRNFTRLKKAGLIRLDSRSEVMLLDRPQLEELAEGSSTEFGADTNAL